MTKTEVSYYFRLGLRDDKLIRGEKNKLYIVLSSKLYIYIGISLFNFEWNKKNKKLTCKKKGWFEYQQHINMISNYIEKYNYYSFKFARSIDVNLLKEVILSKFNNNLQISFDKKLEFYSADSYNTNKKPIELFIESSNNLYYEALDNKLMDNYDDYLIKSGYKWKTRLQYFNVINPMLDELVTKNILFPNHSNRYRPYQIQDL